MPTAARSDELLRFGPFELDLRLQSTRPAWEVNNTDELFARVWPGRGRQ
jgi:hypothetical protein